uniref:Rho-GAP domain-containing protein n=1 Tax=Rhabditophanes sp. KR3021 TaxID=114890 RepID=A0AC35U046_9BILA
MFIQNKVRRVSIFGVPLQGHLHEHSRKVPFILERCIREIEEHGMKYKGIYRTCGVKSKIEAICENFEKISHSSQIDLSEVHPMNVASVIKLYFRKLPEPLMTFELYGEWIRIAGILDDAKPEIKEIVECCDRLPLANYNTFKYLLLHLNRVTWFEEDNLMNAANLANVISPSLLWIKPPPSANRKKASNSKDKKPVIDHTLLYSDAHVQTKTLEYLIKYAFQIFCEDYEKDRKDFFDRYVDEEVKKEEEPGDEEKKLIEDIVLDLNDDDEDPFGSDPDFDADDDSREAANSSKKSLNALASTPEGHQQVSTDFNFMDANDFTVDVLDQYLSQNFAILNSKTECGSNSKSQIPQSYYLGKTLVTPQSEKRSMYTQSAPMAENSSGSRSTLKDEDQKESPDSLYNKHESILRNTSLPVDYPQASNKNDSPKEVQ